MIRQAQREDIGAMHRVRMSVNENRLTSIMLNEADYAAAIEEPGRGWVVEAEGEIVGFAVGQASTGNVWALFVDPHHEGRGYGRQLHDTLVAWLWSQKCATLWLTTEPRTRAERFYESAGWTRTGVTGTGEIRFELVKPT